MIFERKKILNQTTKNNLKPKTKYVHQKHIINIHGLRILDEIKLNILHA